MRRTIFISYSSRDKNYCDELLPALQSVADIRQHVWRDSEEIGVGDHFHPKIQEALADARLAIVLLSNHLLTSRYVMQHELPVLLRLAASGALKLGFLYVSAVAEAALKIDFDSDGRRQTVDLGAIHSFNTWQEPLDIINETGQRNLRYARIADWADREMRAGETPQDLAISARTTHPTSRIRPQPNAKRHDLAIFITDRDRPLAAPVLSRRARRSDQTGYRLPAAGANPRLPRRWRVAVPVAVRQRPGDIHQPLFLGV